MTVFLETLAKYGIKPLLPFGRCIYKYTSLESALKIIENNSLKFSPPHEFNDPFEMTNDLVDFSYTKSDLRKWLEGIPGMSNRSRKDIVKDYHNKPADIRNAFQFTFDKSKAEMGICCFSKSYSKTLMWSHYANNHSGICLGFDFSPFSPEEYFLLCVNYIDKIVPLNYFKDREAVIFYWAFSKSKIWEYEEEVRAVYTLKNGLIQFEKNCLKEVIFGLRTSKEDKIKFMTRLKELNYSPKKASFMIMDPATFDLKEQIMK